MEDHRDNEDYKPNHNQLKLEFVEMERKKARQGEFKKLKPNQHFLLI
jgi:hypothetical protein